MPRYTSQVVLTYSEMNTSSREPSKIVVPDTGVSVALEFWTGAAWVADTNSPITTPEAFFAKNVSVRLTPTPSNGGFWADNQGAGS